MPDPSSRQLVVTDVLSTLAARRIGRSSRFRRDSDASLEAARWPESW